MSDDNHDSKTDLQRRFLIGSSLAFAGTAASGVLTGCGGSGVMQSTASAPSGPSLPAAATPSFAPAGGVYSSAQNVTITSTTSGSTVYYTADGTMPTTSSTVYSGAVPVSATQTMRAIATASGYQESGVGSAAYTISTGTASPLTITTTSPLLNAVEGNIYSVTMAATGGVPPYTWALVSDIGSTNTWTVSSTGVVSGTPANVETDTLSIKVTDSKGNVAGPQSFSIAVQSSSGLPSAPASFQLINQGGPNASQQDFYNLPTNFGGGGGTNSGSATGLGISANYQGFTWLPATPGSNSISHYNVYRNGTLYDSISTPLSITGYIAPGTDSLGQSVGILTVVSVSGGSSTNGISDGKILCGLKLSTSASGFVAGTKVVAYSTAAYGGGGTGNYYVDQSQTVGSSSSHQTFTGWAYNDTASTNAIPFDFSGVATIYAYTVTAVDTASVEGPHAYPTAYMYQGISMTGQANFSYGGNITWNDTTGAPVNGPYDVSVVQQSGGYGFQPVWCGAAGDNNNHTYMCPTQHFENGAFNFVVFDMKPNDSTYNGGGAGPVISPIMRSFGCYGGADTLADASINVAPYATPPFAAGQWSRVKIPFSDLGYGVGSVQGTFKGVGLYQGQITVTSINSLPMATIAGCTNITGPGIPANSYTCGGPNGGQNGWTDPQGPYTSFPFVLNIYGPNIKGTENSGPITIALQGSSCYKQGWNPNTNLSGTNGTIFLNNIGFSTV
jgi:hypothetical protein